MTTFNALPTATKNVHATLVSNRHTGGAATQSVTYASATSGHDQLVSLGLAVVNTAGKLEATPLAEWAAANPTLPLPGTFGPTNSGIA